MIVTKGKTVPYKDIKQVNLAMDWLEKNRDVTYLLIFKLTLFTGLRISDVLRLRYDDNLKDDHIELVESKAHKQSLARAKLRVLKRTKDLLIAMSETKADLAEIFLTPTPEIMALVPSNLENKIIKEIAAEQKKVIGKKQVCILPADLIMELKARKKAFKNIDNGNIFAKATLSKTAGINRGETISRAAVWLVFRQISGALGFDFPTACHQLRKTFAVFLYHSSGNDGALVVKRVGWQDEKLLQTYLSIDDSKADDAVKDMQSNLKSNNQKGG